MSLLHRPHVSTIYDVAAQILGSFDKNLAEYATAKFNRAGISIKGSRHVTGVGEGYLDIKEEGKVPFGLLVWNTGLAANPLVESIQELQKDEKTHSLRISDQFRTYKKDGEEMKDVFCIGDASALEQKLPATAQGESAASLSPPLALKINRLTCFIGPVASQEAQWLAKVLNSEVSGKKDPGSFVFHNQGVRLFPFSLHLDIQRADDSLDHPDDGLYRRMERDRRPDSGRRGPEGRADRARCLYVLLCLLPSIRVTDTVTMLAGLLWRSAYLYKSLSWRNKISLLYVSL